MHDNCGGLRAATTKLATKLASDEDLHSYRAYVRKEDPVDKPDELATNKQPHDVCGDGSVMKVRIKSGESGARPKLGDICRVNYEGRLTDMLDIALRDGGAVFDASSKPFEFSVGSGVIAGWSDAATTLKRGENAKFVIKPEKAYGAKGDPPNIPADATLEFDIEMLSWETPDDLEDINEDGSVLKKVLKKGVGWQQPTALRGSNVVVHLIGRTKAQGGVSGEVFINTVAPCDSVFVNTVAPTAEGRELRFKIGQYPVAGLNDIVSTMRRGEICEALVRPDRAFGGTGSKGFDRGRCAAVAPNGMVAPNTVIEYEVQLVCWSEVEELVVGGGVTIKKLDDPDGYGPPLPRPVDMSEVKLQYTLSMAGLGGDCGAASPAVGSGAAAVEDAAVASSKGSSTGDSAADTVFDMQVRNITVDEGEMGAGVDLAVKTMKEGQSAQITIAPAYGFGLMGGVVHGQRVPPNAVMKLDVKLVKIVLQAPTMAQVQAMNAVQRFARYDEMKLRGNHWFKKKDYERANRRYSRALEAVETEEGFEEVSMAQQEEREQKRLTVLINRAQCYLSQKRHTHCARDCRDALSPWDSSRSTNVKALYRLGCAELGLCAARLNAQSSNPCLNKAVLTFPLPMQA
jgi:FK506-binding protein 4/5